MGADPPEISVENGVVYSGEGQEAILVCIVHGETQPDVSIILKFYIFKIIQSNLSLNKFIFPLVGNVDLLIFVDFRSYIKQMSIVLFVFSSLKVFLFPNMFNLSMYGT